MNGPRQGRRFRSDARSSSRSVGSGASNVIGVPVAGWVMVSFQACRAWRGKLRQRSAMAASSIIRHWRPAYTGSPNQGVTDVGHVDAYLVRAAGDQPALQESAAGEALADPVERARLPPARDHGHALALGLVAGDRGVHDALAAAGLTVDHRQVALVGCAPTEGEGQGAVRGVVLGGDQHPRGVLVEPVHDPGALHAAHAREVPAVRQQRVYQGAVGVARRGVDDEPRRLVDDDQVLVLEKHVQRHLLREQLRRNDWRREDFDHVAWLEELGGLAGRAVAPHASLGDPAGDLGARPAVSRPGKEAVQPQPCVLRSHNEGDRCGVCLSHRVTRTRGSWFEGVRRRHTVAELAPRSTNLETRITASSLYPAPCALWPASSAPTPGFPCRGAP